MGGGKAIAEDESARQVEDDTIANELSMDYVDFLKGESVQRSREQ